MEKRIIMRVELDPASKVRLDEFCKQTGMTKIAAVSRLIDWFSQQPDAIQAIVQGHFPPSIEADVGKMILKRLAAQRSGRDFK